MNMNRNYQSYGRDQINIENLHLSKTGQELLNTGLQLLSQKNYKQAIEVLTDAIKTDPSLSGVQYYLAIALLEGKKPRKVDGWTIEKIEKYLSLAINRDTNPAKCYALWAIVKYGHYTMNSFIEYPPTSDELFRRGESIQAKDAREIFDHFSDPSNPYWLKLHNKFGKSY